MGTLCPRRCCPVPPRCGCSSLRAPCAPRRSQSTTAPTPPLPCPPATLPAAPAAPQREGQPGGLSTCNARGAAGRAVQAAKLPPATDVCNPSKALAVPNSKQGTISATLRITPGHPSHHSHARISPCKHACMHACTHLPTHLEGQVGLAGAVHIIKVLLAGVPAGQGGTGKDRAGRGIQAGRQASSRAGNNIHPQPYQAGSPRQAWAAMCCT